MISLAGIKTTEREDSARVRIFKHLFGVEFLSVGVSAVITAVAYWLITRYMPLAWQSIALYTVLPFTAPLFEKPAFLIPYIWVGFCNARKKEGRWVVLPVWPEIKNALREYEFIRILRADILYHDSGYTICFLILSLFVPATSSLIAGLEAAISFVIAVLLAAYLEVEFVNWRFSVLVRKLQKHGGRCERYEEVKYLITGLTSAREALSKIACFCHSQVRAASAIKGVNTKPIIFSDPIEHRHRYWDVDGVKVARYNDWRCYLLIRESEDQLSLHIVFWRTVIVPPAADSVTGITVVEKIKLRFALTEVSLDEIQKILEPMRRAINLDQAEITNGVRCVRTFMSEEDGVSVNIDRIIEDGQRTSYGIAEIKAWPIAIRRMNLLHESLMLALHALPTTQPRALAPPLLAYLRSLGF